MTEGERIYREDAERLGWIVTTLPKEVEFTISRQMQPEGVEPLVNPYSCTVAMYGADRPGGEGDNTKRWHTANGSTMYEAMMRALADAHAQKAVNIRMSLVPRAAE